jgi:nitrite reductase/ring-hydroxylating ferredoxin subunit
MVPRVLELLDADRAFAGNAFDETDLHIVCPWHGWEFSIRSGEHAAISDIRLTTIHVEESAGRITIAI